jgi:lipopolysaccharide export system protein LptC
VKIRYFFILIIAIAAMVWLMPTQDDATDLDNVQQDFTPEFTAKDLRQSLYNEKGELFQEVVADEMEHYTELKLTYFKNPTFTIYQNNNAHWNISASEGNIQDNLLTLDTKVVMQQLGDSPFIQTISTEYLEIDLDSNTVMTDNDILIEGTKIRIIGKGLLVDLNEGNVSLTNHVETIIKRS